MPSVRRSRRRRRSSAYKRGRPRNCEARRLWSDGADTTTQCLAQDGRQAMRGRRSCVRGSVLARACVHARPGNARAWCENWRAGAHENWRAVASRCAGARSNFAYRCSWFAFFVVFSTRSAFLLPCCYPVLIPWLVGREGVITKQPSPYSALGMHWVHLHHRIAGIQPRSLNTAYATENEKSRKTRPTCHSLLRYTLQLVYRCTHGPETVSGQRELN